ncbi:MAG TPA: energy-coupling factor ABC transporter permease [Firmicutes bacterium]|nr:energy-coupling factor ABC transporter permease [Bacillota bacterium]HHY99311.1 energy-coupling factor ABC transporter permease [Bacillota bacterium]
MHIPDGFLDTKTWLGAAALSAGVIAYSIRMLRKGPDAEEHLESSAPMMGVMAAFIFAAQMLNFPVAGGTSGHLIGAVLAMILLGPHRALIVMTSILIVQSLIFQDGGITALGANVLNMGVAATFLGYAIIRFSLKTFGERRGLLYGTFAASWCSAVAAAALAALELAFSNTAPLGIVFPAMVGWHALIGIGEGLITLAVVSYVAAVRPDLLRGFLFERMRSYEA